MFPDGPGSPHQLVRYAYDGDEQVGRLWLSTRTPRSGAGAFIYEIRVGDQYRGRGYGRAIMLAAEQECRDRHIDRLELNAFGGNEAAIALSWSGCPNARDLGGLPTSYDWRSIRTGALIRTESLPGLDQAGGGRVPRPRHPARAGQRDHPPHLLARGAPSAVPVLGRATFAWLTTGTAASPWL
ncbi:MAG: GNAT family N-acetyltransferase [Kribbellaceae bacterium]